MAGKREALRNELTRRLLEAATGRMERYGLDGVSAREITADAHCGLGTIYKCYRDLDELILHVNSRTLKQLDSALAHAVQPKDPPNVRLVHLALAYLDFAVGNNNAWSALFKHRMSANAPVPDWHIAEHRALFQHICRPLLEIDPSLTEEALGIRARTIFAAVHGIVTLSIEGKFVGLERDVVSAELETVVHALVRGLKTGAA
ncbi:MAG: TetR/AcrR family transcriptional regulator [Hyphomicrobium sp.]